MRALIAMLATLFWMELGALFSIAYTDAAIAPAASPVPHCVSWLFATHADTSFYETQCTGSARPDSIANPETSR